MRSRRLPGQRAVDPTESGVRRPPPPPEPAPLPAEVYFDAEGRRKAKETEPAPIVSDLAHPSPAPMTFSSVFGARTVTASSLLLQALVGPFMMPRIINAAEMLLAEPLSLVTLGVVAFVELCLAAWGFFRRSWLGTWASVACGAGWWVYLLNKIS